jgi:hypothetical protein
MSAKDTVICRWLRALRSFFCGMRAKGTIIYPGQGQQIPQTHQGSFAAYGKAKGVKSITGQLKQNGKPVGPAPTSLHPSGSSQRWALFFNKASLVGNYVLEIFDPAAPKNILASQSFTLLPLPPKPRDIVITSPPPLTVCPDFLSYGSTNQNYQVNAGTMDNGSGPSGNCVSAYWDAPTGDWGLDFSGVTPGANYTLRVHDTQGTAAQPVGGITVRPGTNPACSDIT